MSNGKLNTTTIGNAISMNTSEVFKDEKNEAAIKAYNSNINTIRKSLDKQVESQSTRAKELQEKIDNDQLEIKPINGYILVRPFSSNPFNTIQKTKSGLIIPEQNLTFKNPDTGEMEQAKNLSVQAEVVDVSPLNKFVSVGDIVYYRDVSSVPIPFFHQGLEVIAEQNVQAVVGTNLTKRFEEKFK